MTLIDRLRSALRRFQGKSPPPSLRPEELQRQFIANSRSFRELLSANNHAREAMAEMEQVLQDGRTLSMTFIRVKCTGVAVNVYKIIRNLHKIADNRYHELDEVFTHLQQRIDTILDRDKVCSSGPLIIPLAEISRKEAGLTGNKMANLGEVGALTGMLIPPGFALTAVASQRFFAYNNLYPAINHVIQQMDIANLEGLQNKSATIGKMIRDCPLPPELDSLLSQHYDTLAASLGEIRVALRSSALGEDLPQTSFAGLYQSKLNVTRGQLADAYKVVLASKYSPRAISYRLAKGYRHEETEMGVGCLAMIEAQASGICYTRSLDGRIDTLDLFFAGGSGQGIADGTRSASHFILERTPPHRIIQRVLTPLKHQEERKEVLSDEQARKLAALAMELEGHFGSPQEIEWSIDPAGRIYILQSRPIAPLPIVARETLAGEEELLLFRGGVTGSGGVSCGPVFHLRSPADMFLFPKKAILVVKYPLPKWSPLLHRAAGLIAGHGNAASHLATLCREFGVPALLALGQATEQLANGELVTVDASNRAIYRGRIEELLRESTPKPNPLKGSPVEKTLIEALYWIRPLTLTDAAAPDFRAAHCRTMHDLTRFCHERAVIEMIDWSNRCRSNQGAAKRINDSLPCEWWVINLEDGFDPAYDARRSEIAITDIVSTPMLALWQGIKQGIHAAAREEPFTARLPALVSSLLRSAFRSGAVSSLSSAWRPKNYFLISKNYCTLSVRLGCHSAMIEAGLGSRPVDRYLAFYFKGGAARAGGRLRCMELLADILTRFDFRVELAGEALTARVENGAEQFLYDRLRILGYLTIHTRQIDTVLGDDREYQACRSTFIQDIEEMLNNDQ